MGGKLWTKEEEEILTDFWGVISVGGLAKKLGRTMGAVRGRAEKMNLGPIKLAKAEITFNNLMREIGYAKGNYSFLRNRFKDLKVIRYKLENSRMIFVRLDDFWEFAEKNKRLIDFSKLEKWSLGKEPTWVDKQRRIDSKASKRKCWSTKEEKILKEKILTGSYTYIDLAKMFNRTQESVRGKAYNLGISGVIKKRKSKDINEYELNKIKKMYLDGYSIDTVAKETGKAINTIYKYFLDWGKENANI